MPPFYFTLFEENTYSFTLASIPTSLAECADTFNYILLNDVNNAQVGDEFKLEPKLAQIDLVGKPVRAVWHENTPHRFVIAVSSKTTGALLGKSDSFLVYTRDPCDETEIIS